MGTVGDALKKAREQQGVTLREAEKETKIRLTYLQALEEAEFDKLPGRVYALGFLRSYCRFLGIDASPLVEELKSTIPLQEEPAMETSGGYSGGRLWLAAILLVLVIASASFFVYKAVSHGKDVLPEPPGVNEILPDEKLDESGEIDSGQTVIPEQEPAGLDSAQQTPDSLELTIKIDDEPGSRSWMLIRQDGQTAFSGELKAGEEMTFKAEREVFIRLGNAGTVMLNLNGKQLEKIGETGQVKERTFTLDELNR